MLPKVAAESCSPKLCSKTIPQTYFPFKIVVQSCSGSPKLLPKPAPQSCSPKPFPKFVIGKLLRTAVNLPPKIISEYDFPKFDPKTILQSYCPKTKTYSPKRLILQSRSRKLHIFPKGAPQNCGSSKLPCKAAPQSCSLKLLPKVVPGAAPQSCSPKLKRLPKAILQSRSQKLPPKVATTSCSPKLLPKTIAPKLRIFKPRPQNGSPKLFCKAAPESCSRKLKLLPKVATESCSPKWFAYSQIVL